MEPIAMGSCYLDKGEGKTYVDAQIKRMAKMKPVHYFFDIICRPDQIAVAIDILDYFYMEVGEIIPELSREHIFAGVTCNEFIRPAAMALVVISKGSDVAIADINPERRPR